MENELLSILACPKCKSDLTLAADEQGLICESCSIVYPIRNGIPVMLIEEASPLRRSKGGRAGLPPAAPSSSSSKGELAIFSVVEGKNKGEKIILEKGTCRALGRSLDDTESTRIFSVDSVLSLDDASKKLVVQYVSHQFRKEGSQDQKKGGQEDIGGILRGADYQVKDTAVSRLHAMVFYDEVGGVGILDLVSKNGTFVNGAEVESKILKKGDLITVGSTKIRFEG